MGNVLNLLNTPIHGLMLAETIAHKDARGVFSRLYCEDVLRVCIGERRIVQINHSHTPTVGTVRGLHFQYPPYAEMKLVRCLKGRVWDVAVDLRTHSATFLHWHAEELTPLNARMMVIPEGFAHGFQVLEPDTELLYLHTAFYTPQAEGGLRFDDPMLAIKWPIAVTELSERDAKHPHLTSHYVGISA
jgi:dTDP-4-dehydrorhamnose 3,5-epimerase